MSKEDSSDIFSTSITKSKSTLYPVSNIYIFQDTHLPKQGWLQGCFRCYNITAETMEYPQNYKTYKRFLFYLCPKCKLHINKPHNKERYGVMFIKYIRRHY
jgi:hypothetical protein